MTPTTMMSSFQNFHHQQQQHQGTLRGIAYKHELFVKDHPEYCRRMRRVAAKYNNRNQSNKVSPSSTIDKSGTTLSQEFGAA